MTNKKLHQFNLRDNELCDECQSIEDISHLFFDCPTITRFWNSLKNWLDNNTDQTNCLDKKSIMLGNRNNELIINTLIIITKHEVYKKKMERHSFNPELSKTGFSKTYENEHLYRHHE